MTKVSPHQIATFATVVKERSFTKAAQTLGVSQSSVTQQIGKLEKMLGAPLFIRRRSGLILTQAARELSDMAQTYVVLGDAIHERISKYRDFEDGHLKLVATTPSPVLGLIRQFLSIYPNIKIDLSVQSRTTCLNMIKNREADLGVIIEPGKDDDFISTPYRPTHYMATMGKDHRFANRKELCLSELAGELIVMPEDSSFTRQIIRQKLAEMNLPEPNLLRLHTFPLVKEAVLHGLGIAFFLKDSVYPSTALKSVSIKQLSDVYMDHIVVPRERRDFHLIKAFMRFSGSTSSLTMGTD